MLIEGAAGIGKSSLLSALSFDASALGFQVISGQATELDQMVPLSTLRGLMGGTCAAVGSVNESMFDPLPVIEWIEARLAKVADERPLLVALDDVQWCDDLTAWALRSLVPALSSAPMIWVLAHRPGPAGGRAHECVDRLVEQGAQRWRLEPLGEVDVARLCAAVLGAEPGPSVLAMARRAGGVPFLIEELLTALRHTGRVTVVDGLASIAGERLPVDFRTAALDRCVSDLSAETRKLLDAGSVLQRPFTVHEVAKLLGVPAPHLLPSAEEAISASVLIDSGRELAFRHDLIREAMYDQLPPAAQAALHREAAIVVRDEGRSAAEAAEHLLRSGCVPDRQAVGVLRGAVEEVAPARPRIAAELIQRTLDLVHPDDAARPGLITDAVRLLAQAGKLVEAKELGESELRSGLDPADEPALLLALSVALYLAGQNSGVVEYTSRGLADPRIPGPVRAELFAIRAHALLSDGDAAVAAHAATAAIDVAVRTALDTAVVCGTTVRGAAARVSGRLTEAVMVGREATALADRSGGEARHRHPRLWLIPALTALDQFEEAKAVSSVGEREAHRLGTAWSYPAWHRYRAELWLAVGQLGEADAEAATGIQLAEQSGARSHAVSLCAVRAELAVLAGDLTGARSHLDRTERLAASGLGSAPEDPAWARGLYLSALGDDVAALRALSPIYDGLPALVSVLVRERRAAAELVRIACAAGARRRAEEVVEAARTLADRNPTVESLTAAAAHAEGLLQADLMMLRTAVHRHRTTPRSVAMAIALEDAAVAEGAAGHRSEAQLRLQEALDLYTRCGAVLASTRVRRSLGAVQTRRRPRARSPFGPGDWNALTRSELRVVRLVASGMTNREVATELFLSPHTVDSHIRHSFTKLGVRSRVELTRYALMHDVDKSPSS